MKVHLRGCEEEYALRQGDFLIGTSSFVLSCVLHYVDQGRLRVMKSRPQLRLKHQVLRQRT